jgi:hypothetical protein
MFSPRKTVEQLIAECPIKAGDILHVRVDWPDRLKLMSYWRLLDVGRYRVLKVRGGLMSHHLPDSHRLSLVLVKEAMTGRRHKYEHSIDASYFVEKLGTTVFFEHQ